MGDRPDLEADSMASQHRRGIAHPLSFLRPTTAYGDPYTPSYTRYINAPGSSYVHPLYPLFNDRRPPPKIRTSLRPPSLPEA